MVIRNCGTRVTLLEIINSSLNKQHKQVPCHSGEEILCFMWIYPAFSTGSRRCHYSNAILQFVSVEQIRIHNSLDVKKNNVHTFYI